MILRVGSRPSLLAKEQVKEIKNFFPDLEFVHIPIETKGDKDKLTSISETEESNFFTAEIEEALIKGEIDLAVHSAKDIEENMPGELKIAALTKSISPYECLVASGSLTLAKLPKGASIGVSSKKRKTAIKKYRGDLTVKDIRGNIEERLRQLDQGKFDALVVAHAALIRLGLEDRIAEIISPEIIRAHPLQGSLALQVRSDNQRLLDLFSAVDIYRGKNNED